MRLTIHRGTHEIGGNCLEVSSGNSRIILDIGLPLFNEDREPHDTGALRRQTPEELRLTGVLPSVPGLFDDGPTVDAILLSHAHEDHTGLLRHSRMDIPIYASVGTSKMMLAGTKFAGQPALPRERHRELASGQPVQIGDFTVTPFSVDHSIYGSQAFLIEAEGKTVLYSGDLRLHGRKPGMHRALVEAVKDRSIDVLLMEGTHIGHPDHRGPNEYDLENQIADHIRSATGLVLASFSPQHVDRLVGFLRATKKTGRTFVADAYTAFVMHLIASETPVPRPESTEWVKVFFPKFFEESYRRKQLEGFVSLMSRARMEIEEIRSNPSRYVMLFRPSMLESDFGGVLPVGSRCLYSRWTGYLDRPDWQPVRNALQSALGDLIEIHTSGHIHAADIAELVGQIKAKVVIPVHTFEPERFHTIAANVRILKDGETLEL
ncbi:MBL fold metallo-hydrolase [Planctomicrobium sp. SH664]|uniref:MBL fold metallo-hydrolase n=1 Tax=Planctomicrobium sp. SH664 TaxID=3448125 RepID=UPI003F5CA951